MAQQDHQRKSNRVQHQRLFNNLSTRTRSSEANCVLIITIYLLDSYTEHFTLVKY